jgi:two-component system, OmpR family, sensor histidine kinase CpxA
MRSLFLKIFLSFWAAQALFIVLAILVTLAMRPVRESAENMGSRILAEAANAYATGGEQGVGRYMEGLHDAQHVRGYLFDQVGRDLSGRMPPPWVEDVRRTGKPHFHSWLDRLLPARFSRHTGDLGGQRYTLVLERPPGPRIFFGPHGVPGLGITIAVLSSGLVCYLLAWSLTSPVARLRRAAQSLAAGDLTARAGAPMKGRRDELAELMRDFDRMAERIEALMEAQSRLLNDVSHELRSPLARLSVALGLARRRASPEAEGALNRIELESDRLNQLIQRLLTISRLEAGTDGLRRTRLSLRELVEQVAHDAEYESPGRGFRVSGEGAEDYVVLADPDLLRSAIENVVRNATRYSGEGTVVEIRLERQYLDGNRSGPREEFVVRVLDSGPGVPNKDLERIFQPFYRVDDARTQQTGGAGLGLSITERAVRLHGGRVRASNRAEGGLEVEIRIPAAPAFALPAHS